MGPTSTSIQQHTLEAARYDRRSRKHVGNCGLQAVRQTVFCQSIARGTSLSKHLLYDCSFRKKNGYGYGISLFAFSIQLVILRLYEDETLSV